MSVTTLMTAEDLWAMPEVPGKRFELVRGELVEMPGAGGVHAVITRLLFRLLDAFVLERRIGEVFQDGLGYLIDRDSDIVRVPAVSFVSPAGIASGGMPNAFWPVAPDLAVEIASPGDHAEDIHAKVLEYLEGGTRLVWVLWPGRRTVTVHPDVAATQELGLDDDLDGGDVLPGFRVRVATLFGGVD